MPVSHVAYQLAYALWRAACSLAYVSRSTELSRGDTRSCTVAWLRINFSGFQEIQVSGRALGAYRVRLETPFLLGSRGAARIF